MNFKVFKFADAIHLPIVCTSNIETYFLYKGCIEIEVPKRFGMIRLGFDFYPVYPIKKENVLLRLSAGKLIFKSTADIRPGCSIICTSGGNLYIGDDFVMNEHSLIFCTGSIRIGDTCRLGWRNQVMDSNFHFLNNVDTNIVKTNQGEIIIGNNVWITNNCSINKGTVLPDFATVASGSLVNSNFADCDCSKGGIFAGRPAKLCKTGYKRIINSNIERITRNFFRRNPLITEVSINELFGDDKNLYKN